MPGSALEFRCHSHFLFGPLQATAVKDITVVAEPEVRIRVRVVNNQTPKRRSRVRKIPVCGSWAIGDVLRQYHGTRRLGVV
jgi:hypothetical protein